MAKQFYSLLTSYGSQQLANALTNRTPLDINTMAVGDGNGTATTPDANKTSLAREVYRANISAISLDPRNNKQIIFELTIPENVGGFYIREMGIFDSQNKLIAYANCPDSFKPSLESGSGKVQVLRMILLVNSSEAVTLKVDNSIIFVTRGQLTPKSITAISTNTVDEVGHSHHIDHASTTQKGIVQLSNDTGLDSEELGLSAKAGKVLAQGIASLRLALNGYIPNSKKSDSVTDSSSDKIATSKAAKTAYDKGVEAKTAADDAQRTANAKQSPADTLAGYGINDFKIEQSTGNANDYKTDGNYYFASGQNLPDTDAWHIEVVSGGQADAVRQIARKANDTKIKTRFFNGSSWSSWKDAGGDGVPLGAVVAFPKDIANPQGFLLADGSTFSQQTYPDLYRTLGNKNKLPNLQRSDVGMTAYFAADNIPDGWIPFDSIRTTVTQQNYPELYQHLTTKYGSISSVPLAEDRFIRNAANGLNVGETQGDAIREINGRLTTYRRTDRNDLVMPSGAFAKVRTQNGSMGNGGWDDWAMEVDFSASRVVPTANENRPKSIILKLCIKAKNSFDDVKFWIKAFGEVENVGVLDAGRLAQDIQQVRAEKAGLNHTHTYNQITDFEQGVLRYLNQGFTQNLNEIGWEKLPNGKIEQWGKITLNQGSYGRDTDTSLTFPIAFPSEVLNVQVSYGLMTNKRITQDPVLSALSTTGMTIRQQSDREVIVYWRAIGK